MKLQFDNIVSFVTVVDEGSFSSAARKLGKSQPTISTAIQNLESDLGFDVFIREQNKFSLTAKGKRFYHLSSPLTTRYRDLIVSTQQLIASERMIFRVGIEPFIFCDKVKQALVHFSDQFPNVDLLVVTKPSSVLVDYLNKGKIDVAIGNPYYKSHVDFDIVELFQINSWWVGHRDMNHEHISSARWLLIDGCDELINKPNMTSNNAWYIDDLNTIIELCYAKKGVAFLPDHIISKNDFPTDLTIIKNNSHLFGRKIAASMFWPEHSDFIQPIQWLEAQLKEVNHQTSAFVADLSA
jgi:DNA-binding transcriptional LysR family regulator